MLVHKLGYDGRVRVGDLDLRIGLLYHEDEVPWFSIDVVAGDGEVELRNTRTFVDGGYVAAMERWTGQERPRFVCHAGSWITLTMACGVARLRIKRTTRHTTLFIDAPRSVVVSTPNAEAAVAGGAELF